MNNIFRRRSWPSDKLISGLTIYTYIHTVCPTSSDPFYIVSYYIRWVTTSWTYSTSTCMSNLDDKCFFFSTKYLEIYVVFFTFSLLLLPSFLHGTWCAHMTEIGLLWEKKNRFDCCSWSKQMSWTDQRSENQLRSLVRTYFWVTIWDW